MAVSIATVKRGFGINSRVVVADITGPASYTTGGETLTAAQIAQLSNLLGAKIGDLASFDSEVNTAGYMLAIDRAASKVKFLQGGIILPMSAALSPTVVSPGTVAEQTFTLTGLAAGDIVLGVSKPSAQNGLVIAGQRYVSPNTVGITFGTVPVTLQAALTPASVAANTTAEQTLGFAGILTGDLIVGVSKPTAQAGLGLVGWRVPSAGNVALTFVNDTAGVLTPTAAETYTVDIVRPITPTAAETYQFLVLRPSGATEAPSGTNLSAVTVRANVESFVNG